MLPQDSKEILFAGIKIANAASDGFQWHDLSALMDLPAAVSGWKVGVEGLDEAMKTEEGRLEIIDYVKGEFEIPDNELEDKIEKTISWLNATYNLYLTWTPEG